MIMNSQNHTDYYEGYFSQGITKRGGLKQGIHIKTENKIEEFFDIFPSVEIQQ